VTLKRRQLLKGFLAAAAFAGMQPSIVSATSSSTLILLGTGGGPTPKPTRFPSCYALIIDENVYLIDAGNGVGQQLARAGVPINSVRHVFLTHHHSDHNADAGTLPLLAWATNPEEPITVWGPPPLDDMMRSFVDFQSFDIDLRTRDEGRPNFTEFLKVREFNDSGELLKNDNVRIRCARNVHPPFEHSYALRFDADLSYVFSGDTTYSESVVELATGADVLVHEIMNLTVLDKLIASEPNAKTLRQHLLASHSTPEQVGRVASKAGVKTLVLSHFVPGGPVLSDQQWLDSVRQHFDGEIVVGRDLLTIR
jgi:ribonuclease BN (tRNA processing enzyme)